MSRFANFFGFLNSIIPFFSVTYSNPAAITGFASSMVVAVVTSYSLSLNWINCVGQ
jgi:hypothetical protein